MHILSFQGSLCYPWCLLYDSSVDDRLNCPIVSSSSRVISPSLGQPALHGHFFLVGSLFALVLVFVVSVILYKHIHVHISFNHLPSILLDGPSHPLYLSHGCVLHIRHACSG